MTVFIVPNLSRKSAFPCAIEAMKRLNALGVTVFCDERQRTAFEKVPFVIYHDYHKALLECDCVAAIGGDGTILHTAKHAMQVGKPVFGINAGRLGFLAGLEANELDRLDDLVTRNYSIDERMMLKVTHIKQNGDEFYYALNDAVISKGGLAKIVDLDIECSGQKIASHRADGIIFSTPTGSTAYSLSAGGPVIDPRIDCISMTPICSHSLLSRSIIFSDDKVLTVSVNIDEEHEAYLSIDGEKGVQLKTGDHVRVEKSDIFVRFIKLTDKPFYEILNEKILEKMCD